MLSTQEAVDLAKEIFAAGEVSAALVSEEMLDVALDKGTELV